LKVCPNLSLRFIPVSIVAIIEGHILLHLNSLLQQEDKLVGQSWKNPFKAVKGIVIPPCMIIPRQAPFDPKTISIEEREALIICVGPDVMVPTVGISLIRKLKRAPSKKEKTNPFLPEREVRNAQYQDALRTEKIMETINDKVYRRGQMLQDLQEEDHIEMTPF
jgi:hypothetical protein